MNFKITVHARERYLVRTRRKYFHLQKRCKVEGCQKCVSAVYELRKEIKRSRNKIDAEIIARLIHAKENRSYLNDTEFMHKNYKKFGYSRFQFLVHEEWRDRPATTFVVVFDEGLRYVVTVLRAKDHISGRSLKKKFKKPIDKSRDSDIQ